MYIAQLLVLFVKIMNKMLPPCLILRSNETFLSQGVTNCVYKTKCMNNSRLLKSIDFTYLLTYLLTYLNRAASKAIGNIQAYTTRMQVFMTSMITFHSKLIRFVLYLCNEKKATIFFYPKGQDYCKCQGYRTLLQRWKTTKS